MYRNQKKEVNNTVEVIKNMLKNAHCRYHTVNYYALPMTMVLTGRAVKEKRKLPIYVRPLNKQ